MRPLLLYARHCLFICILVRLLLFYQTRSYSGVQLVHALLLLQYYVLLLICVCLYVETHSDGLRAGGQVISGGERGRRANFSFLSLLSWSWFVFSCAALNYSSAHSPSLSLTRQPYPIALFPFPIDGSMPPPPPLVLRKRKESENKRTKAGLNHHPASQPCDFDYAVCLTRRHYQ